MPGGALAVRPRSPGCSASVWLRRAEVAARWWLFTSPAILPLPQLQRLPHQSQLLPYLWNLSPFLPPNGACREAITCPASCWLVGRGRSGKLASV